MLLSNFLAWTFPLFPLFYVLSIFQLISDDICHVGILFASALTKLIFVSICMDAEYDVTNNSIVLFLQEAKSFEDRNAFMRYTFHEIRVPLNSISLGVQLLLEEAQLKVETTAGDTLVMIHDAVKYMGSTMNDIFAVQKLQEGAMKLSIKAFNVKDQLVEAIDSYNIETQEKRIKIEAVINPDVPRLAFGDKFRIRHTLCLIISNAIKFSDYDKTIDIRLTVTNTAEDEGIYTSMTE